MHLQTQESMFLFFNLAKMQSHLKLRTMSRHKDGQNAEEIMCHSLWLL